MFQIGHVSLTSADTYRRDSYCLARVFQNLPAPPKQYSVFDVFCFFQSFFLPACRRLLFRLLHAENGPFSACNKGNRRRLHAGKVFSNLKTWGRTWQCAPLTDFYREVNKFFQKFAKCDPCLNQLNRLKRVESFLKGKIPAHGASHLIFQEEFPDFLCKW